MKFLRNILLVILLVLVTSAVSLWAITYFVQPNTFKLIAKKQLTSLTKQDSAIEGRVNWRIFPRPGLHLTHVRIGNLEQFEKKQSDYALSVDKLLLNLQIMPLFHGKLVFDQLDYPEVGHGALYLNRYYFEEHIPIRIPRGRTRVAVTDANSHGVWVFRLRVTDRNGFPIPGVSFSSELEQ